MCDAARSPRILISGAEGKMSNYVRAVRAAREHASCELHSFPKIHDAEDMAVVPSLPKKR